MKDLELRSDEELVKLAVSRKVYPQVFKILVKRYLDPLYNFVHRHMNDEYLSQDIVQETFFILYEKIDTFKNRSSFKTWLYQIARNTSLNKLKQKINYKEDSLNKTIGSREAGLTLDSTLKSTDPLPEEQLAQKELAKRIEDVLGRLTGEDREIIEMHYFDGLQYTEIAEIMGISSENVRIRAFRTLIELREMME